MTRIYTNLSQRLIALALITSGSFAAATPICQSASSDSDNDGWGWENDQSCLVASGRNSDIVTCSSGNSDPDGDGWGWENGLTCRVATTDTDDQRDDGHTPVCDSSDSDSDNDGWGWEDDRSCRVLIAEEPPVCSGDTVDDNGDGWGWEDNQTCRFESEPAPVEMVRIMPVGDSITHGHRSVNSYREPLEDLLEANDCNFRYVGSQQRNYLHDGYRAPHEGYSGHTADDFLNGYYNNRGIDHSMSSHEPDVVLLHIGSNDMNRGHSISGTIVEIDQIINIIHQQNSIATVLLANVVPWYGTPQQSVRTLGDRIEAYVKQLSDQRVWLVDVRSGYSRNMMISDGVHPNSTGEAHIADAFYDVYERADLCQ